MSRITEHIELRKQGEHDSVFLDRAAMLEYIDAVIARWPQQAEADAEFEAYAAAEEEDYREYIADLEFWRSGAW